MPESTRYQLRVAAGLCTACGTRPAGTTRRCEECAKHVQALVAARRKRLLRAKTCLKCGAEPQAQGRHYCQACLRYFAQRVAARANDASRKSPARRAEAPQAANTRPAPKPEGTGSRLRAKTSTESATPSTPRARAAPLPPPLKLSNRQIKEADRVGGIELMIPYPQDLVPGRRVGKDREREATPTERERAEHLVGQACRSAGLVPVHIRVACVRPPGPASGGEYAQLLAVTIIGRRWVHARRAPLPRVMFVT